MHFIQTNTQTIIANLGSELLTLTPNNLNFTKITKAIKANESPETIRSLITPIPPDATLYKLYIVESGCFYVETPEVGTTITHAIGNTELFHTDSPILLGVYLSIAEMRQDYPEHFI